MYKIVLAPDEVLRNPAKPVDLPVAKLQKIIEEMRETLMAQSDPDGVGLAANQVGLPYRLFLARFGTKKAEPIHVFINPEILKHSEKLQPVDKKAPLEGCLSIPKLYGTVKRWQWVKVRYQTIRHSGEDSERSVEDDSRIVNDMVLVETLETFAGFPAVVIQHEVDHLNGHVFVEKILEQKGKMYRITGKDKKGKEEWEEVKLA